MRYKIVSYHDSDMYTFHYDIYTIIFETHNLTASVISNHFVAYLMVIPTKNSVFCIIIGRD